MSFDVNGDLIFIASGAILGVVFAYLVGEIILHCIKLCGFNSESFGTIRSQPRSPSSIARRNQQQQQREQQHELRIMRTSSALEVGIDIFSPRFLESARASQREIVRTFVEELRLEREREGVRKLGLLPITEYNVEENVSTCSDCAICLEDFEQGEECRVLVNCSHMFHSHCADDWLKNNQQCPICRAEI